MMNPPQKESRVSRVSRGLGSYVPLWILPLSLATLILGFVMGRL